MKLFHYSNTNYSAGELIHGKGNYIPALTPGQKIAEAAIRAVIHNGDRIRDTALYTWQDASLAIRLFSLSGKKALYELEALEGDILLRGDLNYYGAAADAAQQNKPFDTYVANYVSGMPAGGPFTEPRMEVLVTKATVVSRLA
jgi:hypothetical protein